VEDQAVEARERPAARARKPLRRRRQDCRRAERLDNPALAERRDCLGELAAPGNRRAHPDQGARRVEVQNPGEARQEAERRAGAQSRPACQAEVQNQEAERQVEAQSREGGLRGADRNLPRVVVLPGADRNLPQAVVLPGGARNLPQAVVLPGGARNLPQVVVLPGADRSPAERPVLRQARPD